MHRAAVFIALALVAFVIGGGFFVLWTLLTRLLDCVFRRAGIAHRPWDTATGGPDTKRIRDYWILAGGLCVGKLIADAIFRLPSTALIADSIFDSTDALGGYATWRLWVARKGRQASGGARR